MRRVLHNTVSITTIILLSGFLSACTLAQLDNRLHGGTQEEASKISYQPIYISDLPENTLDNPHSDKEQNKDEDSITSHQPHSNDDNDDHTNDKDAMQDTSQYTQSSLQPNNHQTVISIKTDNHLQKSTLSDSTSTDINMTMERLSGNWIVNTEEDRCSILLTQTAWPGGHRASTQNCNLPWLRDISSWTIKDKEVVLKSSTGLVVSRLLFTVGGSLLGRTFEKEGISLSQKKIRD